MTTPQQEASDAERTRDQLEQAAMALFLASSLSSESGDSQLSESDEAVIRKLLSTTATWVFRSIYRSGYPENLENTRSEAIVEDLLPAITSQTLSTRRWAAGRTADPGELSVQRQAARGLATTIFNAVGERVGESLPSGRGSPAVNKIWVTRADARVRPLHRKLHGDVRRLGADFYRWTTGQRLRYPGDPLAPPDATIGCRCVLVMSTATAEDVVGAFPELPDEGDPDGNEP